MHADLDQLRALEALVRLRSVTAAGRAIGLTQSATSHVLARLRAVFGDDLLVRTRAGMVPTAAAEGLAEGARRILAEVAELHETRAAFDPATARRTFVIAMSDGGQLMLLPTLLEQLAKTAPGVSIALQPAGGDVTRLLETGAIALELGTSRGKDPATLRQQTLFDDRLVWVVRKSTPAPTRLSLAEYVARGRVRIERPGGEPALDRALAVANLPPPSTVTVHSLLAALMIVQRTDRVLTMASEAAKAVALAMPLRVLPAAVGFGALKIVQRWHPRVQTDPAHTWLRQYIKRIADSRSWASAR
jgi:DNA-binding transcriptional LysR family regulator